MVYGRCLRDTCEMPLRIPSEKNVEETFTSHLFLLLTRSMGSIRRWVSSWICLRSSANFSDRSWDRRFVENSLKKNYRPKHVFIELQQATRISRYLWLISTSHPKSTTKLPKKSSYWSHGVLFSHASVMKTSCAKLLALASFLERLVGLLWGDRPNSSSWAWPAGVRKVSIPRP